MEILVRKLNKGSMNTKTFSFSFLFEAIISCCCCYCCCYHLLLLLLHHHHHHHPHLHYCCCCCCCCCCSHSWSWGLKQLKFQKSKRSGGRSQQDGWWPRRQGQGSKSLSTSSFSLHHRLIHDTVASECFSIATCLKSSSAKIRVNIKKWQNGNFYSNISGNLQESVTI